MLRRRWVWEGINNPNKPPGQKLIWDVPGLGRIVGEEHPEQANAPAFHLDWNYHGPNHRDRYLPRVTTFLMLGIAANDRR